MEQSCPKSTTVLYERLKQLTIEMQIANKSNSKLKLNKDFEHLLKCYAHLKTQSDKDSLFLELQIQLINIDVILKHKWNNNMAKDIEFCALFLLDLEVLRTKDYNDLQIKIDSHKNKVLYENIFSQIKDKNNQFVELVYEETEKIRFSTA